MSNHTFWIYEIISNTLTSYSRPALPNNSRLCWDYGTNFYALGIANSGTPSLCRKFSIATRAWTNETSPPALPCTQGVSCWFKDGKLYFYENDTNKVYKMTVGGGAWALEASLSLPANPNYGQCTPISDDEVCIDGNRAYSISGLSVRNLGSIPAVGGGVAPAYTLPIQSIFTFLESDGVTPQAPIEQPGGSSARYYAGQGSGTFTYGLKCAFPRTAVTISVVPNAAVDLTAGVEVAPSAAGPWGQSANLGAFAANQVKAYYLRFTVPNPTTPSAKNFTLQASGA